MNSSRAAVVAVIAIAIVVISTRAEASADAAPAAQESQLPIVQAPSPELQKSAAMMEEARQAFARGELDRAVALYTHLTEISEHPERANALEFLGVTRQRKGQMAHAKAVFDRYLREYPQGEGRSRVQQRLAAITAPPTSGKGRGAASQRQSQAGAWDIYGSHSIQARRNTVSINQAPDVTNLSMLQGDLDLVTRRRGENFDVLSRLSAGYREDLSDVGRDYGGVVISNAYLDVADRRHALRTRVGRQSRSSGGVYGRFDGAHLAWDWRDDVSINFVAGFPVQRSSSSFGSERSMYGISADLNAFSDAWDFTLFANNHIVDGIADRRGLGGEFRYVNSGTNVFGLVDYDTLYSTVNATMLGASWMNDSRLSINGSLDYRRSPLLSTSNAIIGQGVNSIDELSILLSEAELQALAEDNTATSSSATLGFSAPLSDRFQLSMYANVSKLETAVSFASLSGASPSSSTIAFDARLVASSWWRDSDAWIIGLRLAESETYRTSTLSLNTRIPATSHVRINPLFRVVYRQNQQNGGNEWIVAPGLRARLRWQRRYALELEVRGDVSERASLAGNSNRSSFYFSLGYRADFGR